MQKKYFGINNSKIIALEVMASQSFKSITKEDVSKIIKIVKSNQEYNSSVLGYDEHIRKAIITFIIASPYWITKNYSQITEFLKLLVNFSDGAIKSGASNPIIVILLVFLLIIPTIFLLYAYLYGDKSNERMQKKYLLFLNVLHESWRDDN